MKKVLVFVMLFSITMNAQTKSEEQAKKVTIEMTEVLSLNEDDTKQVYALQLERINLTQENKDIKGTPEFKALVKPVSKKISKFLGKERMKIWRAHLDAKKKK